MRLNLLVFLSLFILIAQPAFATTIVILRKRDEFVVAADSKGTIVGDDPLPASCKIQCVGNRCFAMSGNTKVVFEGKLIFDGHELGLEALRTGETLEDVLTTFEKKVVDEFHHPLTLSAHNQRDYYLREIEGKSGIAITFFGVDQGRLQINGSRFIVEGFAQGKGTITPQRQSYPPPDEGRVFKVYVMGSKEAIRRHAAAQVISEDFDTVSLARSLVQLEIADNPAKVGHPIDIVRVGLSGVRWVARKKECN